MLAITGLLWPDLFRWDNLWDNAYINLQLENISIWLMDNRLKLNVNKTRYMHFHSGKIDKNINLDIKIDNSTIKNYGGNIFKKSIK